MDGFELNYAIRQNKTVWKEGFEGGQQAQDKTSFVQIAVSAAQKPSAAAGAFRRRGCGWGGTGYRLGRCDTAGAPKRRLGRWGDRTND